MPFESTPSAAAAQASSIQLRSEREAGVALCARVKASTAAVSQNVNPASSRLRCPTIRTYGLTASAVRAARDAAVPKSARVQAKVSARQPNASPTDQARELHSEGPATEYTAAVAQYCSGGFSKYLSPSKRGVSQSLLTSISRGISA